MIGFFIIQFTKPSDTACTQKGKEVANTKVASRAAGYFNPDDTVALDSPQLIVVKNKLLWKEIDYRWNNNTKVIGYAYLGSIHLAKE